MVKTSVDTRPEAGDGGGAKPAQLQADRRLRALVAEGDLRADQPLPGERDLARMVGVSRPTLRAVLGDWRRRGLLRAFGRRGWMLTGPPAVAAAAPLGQSVLVVAPNPVAAETPVRSAGFSAAILLGAVEALHDADLAALSLRPGQLHGAPGTARLDGILAQRPHGVLLFADGPMASGELDVLEAIAERCRADGRPVVAYAGAGDFETVDRVRSDHVAGAAALTEALLADGCRRIERVHLHAADAPERPWQRARDRGHEAAMRAAGLTPGPVRTVVLPADAITTAADFERRVRQAAGFLLELRDDPPQALLCPSDGGAQIVAEALRLLGLDPVRDLRVVGYDNNWRETQPAAFTAFVPALSVDKDNRRIGHELIALLRERPGRSSGPRLVEVPPRVVDPRHPA